MTQTDALVRTAKLFGCRSYSVGRSGMDIVAPNGEQYRAYRGRLYALYPVNEYETVSYGPISKALCTPQGLARLFLD